MKQVDWKKRLAIVSDEASQSFSEAVRICRPLGIEAYDLRLINGERVPFVPEDCIREVERAIGEQGITITGISPGFCKIPVDDPKCDQELSAGLDDTFQLMDRLGVRRLTLFTFTRSSPEAPVPDSVVEKLQFALGRCHSAGFEALLENVPSCWGNTGENLGYIAQRVKAKVVWDAANAPASGGEAYPSGYEAVRGRVALVHLRNWSPDQGYVYIKDGVVDWRTMLSALLADGYDGYFCIESHRWKDPDATRVNTEQLLSILNSL